MQVESWDPSDCVQLLLADGAWESLSKKAPGPGQDGRRLTPERLAAQAGNKRLARLLREAKKKGAGWATVPAAVGEMLSKEERNARLPELGSQCPTGSRETREAIQAKARQETAPAPKVADGAQQEQAEERAESSDAVASSRAAAKCPPLTEAAAAPCDTASESPKAAAAAAATAAATAAEQEVVDDDFVRRVAREAIRKKIQELYGKD